jgi:uncharacterized membrane protein YbaN (DUF454 family)
MREAPRAPSSSKLVRVLFMALGGLLVGIGVLGIFLPLLPTTVFFLMAAGCFGKSSPAAYRWLTTNRFFGSYLRNYKEHHGATLGSKVVSISTLWLGMGVTLYLTGFPLWLGAILLVIAVGVTVHLLMLKTLPRH